MKKSVSTKKETVNGVTTETITTVITDDEGNKKTTIEKRTYTAGSPPSQPTMQAKPVESAFNKMSVGNTSKTQAPPDLGTFRKTILDEHNRRRRAHGAAPLQADAKMNDFAQEWAEHLADINTLQHRPANQRSYGENIFMQMGKQMTGALAVDSWYEEVKKYKFDSGEKMCPGTGHFTQVVWAASERLGTGMAQSSNGAFYVVCDYDPPGNMMGDFTRNVHKPQ